MKRRTRARNMDKDDEDVCQLDVPKKRRCRGKNAGVKKALFDEQITRNTLVNEPTLQSISSDQNTNVNDENSPPRLIIDTDKETDSSQAKMSDYFPRRELIGERLPGCSSNASNRTQSRLSNTSTRVMSNENRSVNIDRSNKEGPSEENVTPVINRSTNGQCTSNIRSQSSNSQIVISVDRRRRVSNEDLNRHHRTSTPIRPTSQHHISTGIINEFNDSFSVDCIPDETYNVLSRFPEFRKLVKAFQNEKKKCETWSKDFARLQNNYNQLEANSFPRPSATALSYLVDLVTQIQQSGGRGDPRTDEQIARDLGLSAIFLMSLKDISPQQTALNLFNHFYPGYEAKVNLGSTNNLEASKPGLLNTILVFAQRSSPGTNYTAQELRNALNNSIRGARFYWRKMRGSMSHATALLEQENVDHAEIQDENDLNGINNDYSAGTDNTIANQPQIERRLGDDESF